MDEALREKLDHLMAQFSLEGRAAVVTGGSQGLGRGMALALAAAGADICPISRTQAAVDAVGEEIRSLGRRSLPLAVDVTDEAQVQ